jgi:hypothetical protein
MQSQPVTEYQPRRKEGSTQVTIERIRSRTIVLQASAGAEQMENDHREHAEALYYHIAGDALKQAAKAGKKGKMNFALHNMSVLP